MKRFSLVAFAASLSAGFALLPAFAGLAQSASPRAGPTAPRLLEAASPAETEYTLGALHIKAPWMRATPKGAKVGGGYLTVVNQGDKPDRLIGIESDIAATVDIHEMTISGGVMAMRPVAAPLEIAPGATLELKPGGYHVMFSELKQGVKEGDRVKATLAFEKAGKVEIEFVAGGLAATGPGTPMHKM